MRGSLRFGVLGPLQIAGDHGPVRLDGVRLRGLLGMLLVHPGRIVSTTKLVAGLWDGTPPKSATANVRTYVYSLRKVLARASGSVRLRSHPAAYELDLGDGELDLVRFEELSARGDLAARNGDFARAEVLLDRAAGLWRGRPLDGLDLGSWAKARLTALEDRRWAVLSTWADARLALGGYDDVIHRLRELAAEHPLRERTWAQLIAALYGAGRTGEALVTFVRVRELLVDEIGLEPGPELCELHRAILDRRPLRELYRPRSGLAKGIA